MRAVDVDEAERRIELLEAWALDAARVAQIDIDVLASSRRMWMLGK